MRLETVNISFQCDNGNREVLNNVSMSLKSGERMGSKVLGGFGKTTFCKTLAGYEKSDYETVALDGKSISPWGGYDPMQMIWQYPKLSVDPHLKMREVLREGGAVEEQVVRGLGIEPDWLNRYPGELSGEESQRLYIVRVLSRRARFILTDEISVMLGLITQSRTWGFLLEEAKARELSLLVVSHSEELLERVCGRVVSLRTDSSTVWI